MAQYAGVPQDLPLRALDQKPLRTPTEASGFMSPPFSAPLLQHRNSQPPPIKKNFHYRFHDIITRFWLWEIGCCLVSLTVFTSMIMMLRYYDNEPTAKWRANWNINSVTAFLTLIMKSAMLIPVAEALGQIKWDQFTTYRKVEDFDSFDQACRGSVGSLLLLFKLRWRFWYLAFWGALIIVGAVSIDTLVQNLITTEQHLTYLGTTALVPRTNSFFSAQKQTTGDEPGDQLAPQSVMVGVVLGHSYLALTNPNDTTISLNVTCASGECTFEKYQTIGIQHQCVDTTDNMKKASNSSVWTYADEISWDYSTSTPIRTANLSIDATLADDFKDIGPLISRDVVIFTDDFTEEATHHAAIECVFYWVVYTRSMEIQNNVINETTHAVDTNTTARTTYGQDRSVWIRPKECWVNGTQFPNPEPGDMNCTARIFPLAQRGMQNTLRDKDFGFPGYQEWHNGTWARCNFFCMSLYSLWAAWSFGGPGIDLYDRALVTGLINHTWENTAEGMTQAIRQLDPPENAWDNVAEGSLFEREPYYVIWWRWIFFPGALVGMSLVFFIYTLVTRHAGSAVWKTSSLPFLFHGFNTGDRLQMGDPYHYVDMLHAATTLETKFATTDEGVRLVSRAIYS